MTDVIIICDDTTLTYAVDGAPLCTSWQTVDYSEFAFSIPQVLTGAERATIATEILLAMLIAWGFKLLFRTILNR